ncbi:hypothetical protein DBV05_g1163 [Lasiodiplodia theobromae]|uniref:Uncharacterized protein n=1 Tax=Lasiodiplodia theobromae TaxID=45133 RepID=A0A5N5DQW0_9PEZI|nr:hypothetical protein DBV05_g1163 [Lasiodiplodia theobromae]
MADPPNIAGDMSSEGSQQFHTDTPPDEVAIAKDEIQYGWSKKAEDCIPPMYRPSEPLPSIVIIRISRLARMAPGTKGFKVCEKLVISSILDRQRTSGSGSASFVREADLKNALSKLVQLLNAVRDINLAVCLHSSFLQGHKLASNDPYDWGFETVVALWDLVKLAAPTRVKQAGNLWRSHFAKRLRAHPNSPKHVISADFRLAIDDLKRQHTGPDDSSLGLRSLTHHEQQLGPTPSGHFCTTGAIFQPALPPPGILLAIGKMFYYAQSHRDSHFKTIPIIMTQEMASKGIFHDNTGATRLGTFLKQDGRNYSYKHFYVNMTAILELEQRFGKPFYEIFECPDIQAHQALRTAKVILPTLAGITRRHCIDQVETLKKVCNEYFDKYPDPEKSRTLTTENVRHLSEQLAIAAAKNADGVKYMGWPSLGGRAAGPATPLAASAPKQQTRRRIREASPTSPREQPATKKPKPSSTVAARAAYVANHVPGRDAILDPLPSRRPAAVQLIAAAIRSRLIMTPTGMREVVPTRFPEVSATLTPAPASRHIQSGFSAEGETNHRIMEDQSEEVESDLTAGEVQTTLEHSSVPDSSLVVHRDTPGEDPAESLEMVGGSADENLQAGMQLYAETSTDSEVFTKLGEEFQQRGIATAEGLHSQMQVQANQAENARASTQTEVQELKQQLQQAMDKIKETDIKAETAEERAKKAEERATEAEQRLEQKVKDLQELAEGSRRLWTQLLEIASD